MQTRSEARAQPFTRYDETGLQELLSAYDARMKRLNDQYLRAMGEHIRDIGTMIPSDVHRLQQIRRMNRNLSAIERRIAAVAGMSVKDIRQIFEQAAQEDVRMAQKILGVPDTVRVSDNLPLQRILQAQVRETAGRMQNLSNTTVVSKPYRNAVDASVSAVQSGVEDYGSAIRRTIREAGQMGLRVRGDGTMAVDYESGYSRRLDSAVRMNILDGVRHLNQSIMEEVGREFGADGVEIDAHMLCAEDHLPYQGRQFSKSDFEEIQSSLPRPFGEWNCRHSWHPILLGISEPTYTPDQLQEMHDYSTEEIEIDGRTKTRYEWSQEMRRAEVAIRQTKDVATLAAAAGDDTLQRQCQGKIVALNEHYRSLAGKAGLKPEFQRTYVAGFRDAVQKKPPHGTGPVAALRNYVGPHDRLYELLKHVKPIDGFEDFGCHGNPYYIEIDTNNGQTVKYNAKQFADTIRSDPEYHGGSIRLLSCTTGLKEDGFARQLAKHLGVTVLAPTEVLWISDGEKNKRPEGEIFVSNIDSLAYLWYDRVDVKPTGRWIKFNPDGTWSESDERGR